MNQENQNTNFSLPESHEIKNVENNTQNNLLCQRQNQTTKMDIENQSEIQSSNIEFHSFQDSEGSEKINEKQQIQKQSINVKTQQKIPKQQSDQRFQLLNLVEQQYKSILQNTDNNTKSQPQKETQIICKKNTYKQIIYSQNQQQKISISQQKERFPEQNSIKQSNIQIIRYGKLQETQHAKTSIIQTNENQLKNSQVQQQSTKVAQQQRTIITQVPNQQLQLLQKIKLIETQLQIDQQDFNNISNCTQNKLQILQQKIKQFNQNIEQLKQQSQQDNRDFIDYYLNHLKKAQELKQCYLLVKGFVKEENNQQNKLKQELDELKNYFKIQALDYKVIQQEINKKQKLNANKIHMLNKKKNIGQSDSIKMEQLKYCDKQINRLKEIINVLNSQSQQKQEQIENNQNKIQKKTEISNSINQKKKQQIVKMEYFIVFYKNNKQIQKLKIQNDKKTFKQLLALASYKPTQNIITKLFYRNTQNDEKTQLSISQTIQKIKVKQVINYQINIQEYITITLDNGQVKQFLKGTDVNNILKKLKIKSRDFYFFIGSKQYTEQTADINLQLRQCQVLSIQYLGILTKSITVPTKVKIERILDYIEFQQLKLQKLQTLFISKLKIGGNQLIIKNPKETIFQLLKRSNKQGKVQQLIIDYKIKLRIQIISNDSRIIIFEVNSKKSIQQLKNDFQKICNIDRKLQKWCLQGTQLANQQSFQTLNIFKCHLGIQVTQIKNLEYYGFDSQNNKILTSMYTNFYVENDQYFQKQLQENNFPQKEYQFAFRIKALSKIFSVIKKHCRIKTAIDSIKSIVSQSSKRCNLWMPLSSKQLTFFNQNYVLFNIINSSQNDLITQMCRTYKNHSAIPLKTRHLNGKIKDLSQNHYWICTKSINIVSLEIKGSIKGKSTFLNEMFKTDFQTELRHPICQRTSFIKYDIYRSTKYTVDLIDVSSDAMSQKQKIQICKHANILIIHLLDQNCQQVKKWINKNCQNIPVIYCFRDSDKINNQQYFNNQLSTNNSSAIQKNFHIPQMCKQNIKYYELKLYEISNQINKFVVQITLKQTNQRKWLLNKYFQRSSKRLCKYTQKLRKLQNQFSTIVDLKLFEDNDQIQKQKIRISNTIFELIDIDIIEDISNFMSKMKQFARNQRNKNLALFTPPLQKLKSILQKKAVVKIQDKIKQICQCFSAFQEIDKNHKTQNFILGQKMYQASHNNLDYQKLEQIYKKYLLAQFQNIIKRKDFSIQNFWRILLYIYSLKSQKKQNEAKNQKAQAIKNTVIEATNKIFTIQFEKGKTIQLINGDTLQMPIKLFKHHQDNFKGKSIMVVAVVGVQSSGKSTLLNFLFGCDFLSSEGRCTSGVYSTYYDVQGENIPGCDGILVLDTQGLFSNYQRKNKQGQNFDNKLVLFLLKVCDILIINNRGDISKNIQDILQLSFDSQLLKYQPGMKYPNFNIVLNMKTDGMNDQNQRQIAKLRQKIVQANSQMEKYFCSDQSSSLPLAFSYKNSQGVTSYLNTIQSTNKFATTQFYQATRTLSLVLIRYMAQRGKKFNSRSLANIYEQFYSTWSMLIRLPILTKHLNLKLRRIDQQIQKFMCKLNQQIQQRSKKLSRDIPDKILLIDAWRAKKIQQNFQFKQIVLNKFQKMFMSKDIQTDNFAKMAKMQIQVKLSAFQTNLQLEITQKKYKLAVSQSQNRGIDDLNKKARLLRSNNLTQQQQMIKFKQYWIKYTQDIHNKIDPRKNSKQIWHNTQSYYNEHVKRNNNKISLQRCDYVKSLSQDYQSYFLAQTQQFNKILQKINTLEAVQIPPVIALSEEGITDLKYNYFDMKKFFQLVPTKFEYYLRYSSISQLVNMNYINTKVQQKIKSIQVIQNFFELLATDLKQMGIRIYKDDIKNALVQAFKKVIRSQNYNLHLRPYAIQLIDVSLLKKAIKEIVFNIYQNEQKKNQNKSDNKYIKKEKKKKKKNIKKNQNQKINPKGFQNHDTEDQNQYQIIQKQDVKYCYNQEKNFFIDLLRSQKSLYFDLIKRVIPFVIKKYAFANVNIYRAQQYELRRQNIFNAFLDLNKLGIFPKQFELKQNYNFVDISLKGVTFKPIQIRDKYQIKQIINQMSGCIHTNRLKNMISDTKINQYNIYFNNYSNYNSYKSQCIAYSYQKKIQIVSNFSSNRVLSMYKDKQYSSLLKKIRNVQFLNIVKNNIDFIRILKIIKKSIESIPNQVKIQQYVQQISIVIKNQLQQFNRDLRQISQVVSMDFKHLLHDITKKLIWKKLQIQKIKQNKKIQQKLKQDQQQQRSIFLGILNINSKPSCQSNAKIFIKAYREFIQPHIKNEKQQFIQQKIDSFLKIFTRKFIQDHVDSEMMKIHDQNILFNHLMYPELTLRKYYNTFVQDEIEKFDSEFKCKTRACINQMRLIINDMSSKLAGAQVIWQVDEIFEDNFVHQKQKNQLGAILKDIFQQLLINGERITSQYKNGKYKIKEGIFIQIIKQIQNHINDDFLKNFPEFEIFNLTYFIQNIESQLNNLENDMNQIVAFSTGDYDNFKQKIKLTLCDKVCPCCDRLCDVDMKKDPLHTIHRIDSGHQMRAVKGIVVQKKVNSNIQSYASVLRCEDVQPKTSFEYYNTEYTWEQFVLQKSNEWNFKSQNSSSLLFQHIWNIAGNKICQHHTNSGRKMTHIAYSDGSITFMQSKQQDTQFIFAIDGSGSMSGSPWAQQLKSLKNILNQISKDSSNTASILVFNDDCLPFSINKDPSKIDTNQIQFPSGGTTPDPTFIKAAEIIRDINKKQSKSVYFFYISDGQASHPTNGIKQLLQCKKQLNNKKLSFNYTSILISQGCKTSSAMQKINLQMGGSSEYVSDACHIGQKVKQILAK